MDIESSGEPARSHPREIGVHAELDGPARDRCFGQGYESLIPALQLPDPNDRHVLAAAIRGRADVIVTANLRDFPEPIISAFGIEAQHPDEFVLNLLDLAPGIVAAAAQEHRQSLRNPPKTVQEYLETLEAQSLT